MPHEPHAVEIAASLRLEWGDDAIAQASRCADQAEAMGHVARCDLYRAVRSVLADRERVTWRWR